MLYFAYNKSGSATDLDAALRRIQELQAKFDVAQKRNKELQAELDAALKSTNLEATPQVREIQAKLDAKSAALVAALERVADLEHQLKAKDKNEPLKNTHFILSRELFNPRSDDNSLLVTPSGKFWWEDDQCIQYLKYTPELWDKTYKKPPAVGSYQVYVGSLDDPLATAQDAAKYASRFRASFPTINFYEWHTTGNNPRWAILAAQGLSEMDSKSVYQFAKQCIVGDAFRRPVSSEGG